MKHFKVSGKKLHKLGEIFLKINTTVTLYTIFVVCFYNYRGRIL